MATKNEWTAGRVQYIKGLKNPTDQQSLLVKLEERSPQDERTLAVLVRAEKADVAAKEAKAAVTKQLNAQAEEARRLETGQKIILGGFFLHELRTNQKTREWFLREWEGKITRDNDQKRLAPLLEELRSTTNHERGNDQ